MILHDSFDAFYRVPGGPAPAGSAVTIRLRTDEAVSVQLRTWRDEEDPSVSSMMHTHDDVWEAVLNVSEETGLMWYSFIIRHADGSEVRYGNAYDQMGGEGAVYDIGSVSGYQLTIYDPEYKTPGFMHGANIYQIFPDRFFKAPTQAVDTRTDRTLHQTWEEDLLDHVSEHDVHHAVNFYGGTLNGIAEKLPYLQELGVTVLYLNPIFQSHSNHRYDTGDYTRVDPLLGTEEELSALCRKAEEMGIRILLDGVFSHCGEDSLYFNALGTYDTVGAAQSEESLWADWFTFRKWPKEYKCWWGIPSLPDLDEENPRYQDFMFHDKTGIIPRWLKAGTSGWRLDVADELPMDFIRKLRTAAKHARRDAVVLGEVWEDASNKVSYDKLRCYCAGDTLDSVMNYPLRAAILDFVTGKAPASALKRLIDRQADVYPAQFRYALMNLIGSHDRARAINVLCGKEGDRLSLKERARLTVTEEEYALGVSRYRTCIDLLCALPGCPTVYYGDEAGLTGAPDPFCRRPFPWGREDKALQRYVAEKLRHHRDSNVLKYGWCEVSAPDDDTIVIHRYLNGHDALGRKAAARQEETFTIRRS